MKTPGKWWDSFTHSLIWPPIAVYGHLWTKNQGYYWCLSAYGNPNSSLGNHIFKRGSWADSQGSSVVGYGWSWLSALQLFDGENLVLTTMAYPVVFKHLLVHWPEKKLKTMDVDKQTMLVLKDGGSKNTQNLMKIGDVAIFIIDVFILGNISFVNYQQKNCFFVLYFPYALCHE